MLKRLILAALIPLTGRADAIDLVIAGERLQGATRVDINGDLYDVEFVDGGCPALFDGCDDASHFGASALRHFGTSTLRARLPRSSLLRHCAIRSSSTAHRATWTVIAGSSQGAGPAYRSASTSPPTEWTL